MKYDPRLAASLLERTPRILRAMLEDLPSEWLDAAERPDAWTPREVACHVADLERDAWIPRIQRIVEHGAALPLQPVDRERFRQTFGSAPLSNVLDDFTAHRDANLHTLDRIDLGADTLERAGQHTSLGEVRLAELLSTWVVHDLTHLAQINRTLAVQYREQVGPWIEFLSVLRWK